MPQSCHRVRCPQCQWPHTAIAPAVIACHQCGTDVYIGCEPSQPLDQQQQAERARKQAAREHRRQQQRIRRDREQRLIAWVRWFATDTDCGVGDTLERLLARVGGRAIKAQLERLGINCGCQDRIQWLNTRFPYG